MPPVAQGQDRGQHLVQTPEKAQIARHGLGDVLQHDDFVAWVKVRRSQVFRAGVFLSQKFVQPSLPQHGQNRAVGGINAHLDAGLMRAFPGFDHETQRRAGHVRRAGQIETNFYDVSRQGFFQRRPGLIDLFLVEVALWRQDETFLLFIDLHHRITTVRL